MSKKIKIAAIGNQNNNHFSLIRYLRDAGYDADLLLTNAEQEHFHPGCDAYDLSHSIFTKQLSWGSVRSLLATPKKQILDDLENYDIIIGTGLAPAYVSRACMRLDVFDPYGSDIKDQLTYKIVAPHFIHHDLFSVYHQRRGIAQSRVIHAAKMNSEYESNVQKFAKRSDRWYEFMPMVYAPQYEVLEKSDDLPCTHWQEEFKKIRNRCDLMIFFGARNNFNNPIDSNAKGVDVFIDGYCRFLRRNPSVKSLAVFTEYGKDVEKAQLLAQNLGIRGNCVWLPKMYRKDLMVGLSFADICCGQFGISWIQNGTLLEALVAGKPLITWRDSVQYGDQEGLYSIYNANSPEQISSCLEEFISDPIRGRDIGLEGRLWYEGAVSKVLDKYCQYINNRAAELGKCAK
jgi:hypothetical protein